MEFNATKFWIPVFVLAILVMAWTSWLFRYTPHPATSSRALVTLDRWTGCLDVYLARNKKYKSCPTKNKD